MEVKKAWVGQQGREMKTTKPALDCRTKMSEK